MKQIERLEALYGDQNKYGGPFYMLDEDEKKLLVEYANLKEAWKNFRQAIKSKESLEEKMKDVRECHERNIKMLALRNMERVSESKKTKNSIFQGYREDDGTLSLVQYSEPVEISNEIIKLQNRISYLEQRCGVIRSK